jgi:hypothetical protein
MPFHEKFQLCLFILFVRLSAMALAEQTIRQTSQSVFLCTCFILTGVAVGPVMLLILNG